MLLTIALQLDHLVLDSKLFLLQPADLEIIGARSGHLFLDPRLQYAVLLGKLREMSGKRFDGGVVEALARSHGKGELVPAEIAAAPRVASRVAAR